MNYFTPTLSRKSIGIWGQTSWAQNKFACATFVLKTLRLECCLYSEISRPDHNVNRVIHPIYFPMSDLASRCCRCLCLSVRLSACVDDELFHKWTCHPFKLGSPNLDRRCKTPWFKSLLFYQGKYNHQSKKQRIFDSLQCFSATLAYTFSGVWPLLISICVCGGTHLYYRGALTSLWGGGGTYLECLYYSMPLYWKMQSRVFRHLTSLLFFSIIGMPLSPCCLTLQGVSHNIHRITHNATSTHAGCFIWGECSCIFAKQLSGIANIEVMLRWGYKVIQNW